jgi:hypothetical protein
MYYKNDIQSEHVDTLVEKLHQLHKEHGVVLGKDSKSFKNTYATLPGILSQLKDMLSAYGLVLTQGIFSSEAKDAPDILYTLLEHKESGQWRRITSTLTPKSLPLLPDYMVERMTPEQWNSYCNALLNANLDQAYGASTTYHRRYDAMMICGMFAVDDPSDFNEGHNDVIPENTSSNQKNGFISEGQQGLLRARLNGDKELANKIISTYNLKNLSEIPWQQFNSVLDFIKFNKESHE